jgi:hypothetical protein
VPSGSRFAIRRAFLDRKPSAAVRIAFAALLYTHAVLAVTAIFAPSLPRLNVPEWLAPGPLLLALMLLLIANLYINRAELPPFRWKWPLVFGAVLALLVLSRLSHLVNHQAWMNSDRSVTLLMIQHITEGVSHPIYFYGQLYQGSLDAYLYALFYRIVPSLHLSIAAANLLVFTLFVLTGAALVKGITGSSALFYPLLFLSMPFTSASFLSMDLIRGIPLIVFFQTAVIYLVFEMVFEGRERAFLLGTISGTLFWIYQPALTTLAVTLAWAAAGLIWRRRAAALESLLRFSPGFLLGALPHLLSEMNNNLFNTRTLFLTPGTSTRAEVFAAANLKSTFSAVVGEGDVNPVVAVVLVTLFIIGCVPPLGSWSQRSLRGIYLPSIFFGALLLTMMSGYKAETRWFAHYRLLTFFTLLLASIGLSRLTRADGRLPRAALVAVWLLFTVWRSSEEGATLHEAHQANRSDTAWLANLRNGVAVGNYFNTFRFAPFVDESTVTTTTPAVDDPNQIFSLSKYYPLALRLGDRWDDAPRHLIVRRRESKAVQIWLEKLSIASYVERFPSGRFTMFSGFSPVPSPYLLSILSSQFRERHLPDMDAFAMMLERRAGSEMPLTVEGHRIGLPREDRAGPDDSQAPEFVRSNWRYVLRNDRGQVSFPLGPVGESAVFTVPADVGPECGTYGGSFHFLDMPVRSRGMTELDGEICDRSLVLSVLTDRLTFPHDDQWITGLPVDGLRLEVRDLEIESLDLHVYSFFDFGSSLWTNRYEQRLTIDDREYPLTAGRNVIRYHPRRGIRVGLESRYKTLLPAEDTSGSFTFHNTGIVIERIVAHRGKATEEIALFLETEE